MKMLNRFPQSYSVIRIPTWVYMDNNAIGSLAHISAQMGFASLRLRNYRGVGNSESYQKDTAEKFLYWEASLSGENYMDAVYDTRAALHFLAEQHIGSRIYIAGYSFGSLVGMRVGVESEMIAAFASISMPFGKYNLDFLAPCKKPKLIIYLEMILQRQRKIPYGVFQRYYRPNNWN